MGTKNPAPLEAEVQNYRRPKRPTKQSLAARPYAVVMLAWAPEIFGEDFDTPADRDFEGFSDLRHAKQYFDISHEWAKNDWRQFKDMRHAVILLDNTKPTELNIHTMHVVGGTAAWRVEVRDGYEDKPTAIYRKTIRDRVADARKLNKPAGGVKKRATAAPVVAKKAPIAKKRPTRKADAAAPKRQNARINPPIKKRSTK